MFALTEHKKDVISMRDYVFFCLLFADGLYCESVVNESFYSALRGNGIAEGDNVAVGFAFAPFCSVITIGISVFYKIAKVGAHCVTFIMNSPVYNLIVS